jgi:hypothetical protein
MTRYSNNGRGADAPESGRRANGPDPAGACFHPDSPYGVDEKPAGWLEKWAPDCPIGNPQRVRTCVGYREREPGRLQLRVPLAGTEGLCEVIVEEHEEKILVRVLVCHEEDEEREPGPEYVDCPVHVYLDEPLNGRVVIDEETGEALALFVPRW